MLNLKPELKKLKVICYACSPLGSSPDIYKALNYLVDKDKNQKTERNKIGYKK